MRFIFSFSPPFWTLIIILLGSLPDGMTEPEDMVFGAYGDGDGTADGDLDDYILVTVWKDFGVDGLPGTSDTGEGDNEHQPEEEWVVETPTPISTVLAGGPTFIDFGEMTGSTTYYYGIAWEVPEDTGNIIQSDSYVANIVFEVEQLRHNPTPWAD